MIATSAMASPIATGDLKYSGANAFEKWRLVASASGRPWDPTDPLPVSRFDSRDVVGGESTRASLAFDWQRNLDASRLEAAAFARRSTVDLHSDLARLDGSSVGERFEQRDRRSAIGAALRWSGAGSLGALPASHSIGARFTTETLDGDGAFRLPGGEATRTLREDRLRQSGASFDFVSELQVASRLRSVASVRYDSYRFAVGSDLRGHQGSLAGTLASPRISLIADLTAASELFVSAGRGYPAGDARGPGAAMDARTGTPIGRLDPLSTAATAQAGWRARLVPQLETTVSLFHARSASEIAFTGETGIGEIARPASRQGVQLSARYQPAAWVAFDLQASALRARFADGAHELVAGAPERTVSAATTLHTPSGWTASLLVSSLGKRESIDDGTGVKPSTFVNARLARSLSKSTRLTLDVFNVFDRRAADFDYFSAARLWNAPGAADSFLFNPAAPRGFRLKLRTTF